MPTSLDAIAARATQQDLWTPAARQAALDAIIDTIGCIIAGQQDISVTAVRAARKPQARGEASLVGGGTAPAPDAALVNGTAAHALDFDDNFGPGMSHASAVLVPALIALGEARGLSGSELISAYLVGLEAQALVGRGITRDHYTAGWHGTSTVGAIGTAAGTASLIGLPPERIVASMSLGVSMAAGVKGQFGTPAKPFHAGMAARNAVEAALLAESGLYGRDDVLEREQGFGDLFAGGGQVDWRIADGPHVIETDGLMPKLHPCCGSTHNAIDMTMDLRREHGFDAEQVARVEAVVGLANYRNLAYPDPRDEMQARFSMQYCIARALRQDVLSLDDFTPQAINDAAIQPLLGLIDMSVMPPEEEKASQRPPHSLRITLHNGRVFEARRAFARGALPDPLTPAQREAKFLDCAAHSLGRSGAQAAYDRLLALESAPSLSLVGEMLVQGVREAA